MSLRVPIRERLGARGVVLGRTTEPVLQFGFVCWGCMSQGAPHAPEWIFCERRWDCPLVVAAMRDRYGPHFSGTAGQS